ncbi:hypothetical protein BDF19DRAFT_462470 [Syncephalis fuscata]|nr:hypothetical protein BDF19DRAFT_462470 [Syncephalis fuscata]
MRSLTAVLWLCAGASLANGATIQRFSEELKQPLAMPAIDTLNMASEETILRIPENDPRLVHVKQQIQQLAQQLRKDWDTAEMPEETQKVASDMFPHISDALTSTFKKTSANAIAQLRHWMTGLFGGSQKENSELTAAATPTQMPSSASPTIMPAEEIVNIATPAPMATDSPALAETQPQPQVEPQPMDETQPQTLVEPQPQTLVEPQPQTLVEPHTQTELQPQTQPQPLVEPHTHTESLPQTQPQPKASSRPITAGETVSTGPIQDKISSQKASNSDIVTNPHFNSGPSEGPKNTHDPQENDKFISLEIVDEGTHDVASDEELRKHAAENEKIIKMVHESQPDPIVESVFGIATPLVVATAKIIVSDLAQLLSYVSEVREQGIPASMWFPQVQKILLTDINYNLVALADLSAALVREHIVATASFISSQRSAKGILMRMLAGENAGEYVGQMADRWIKIFIKRLRRTLKTPPTKSNLAQDKAAQALVRLLDDVDTQHEAIDSL